MQQLLERVPLLSSISIKIGTLLHLNFTYLTASLVQGGMVAKQHLIASSIILGFLMPFIGSLSAIPIYFLGRAYYDAKVGLYAAILFATVPSLILFTPQMDQIFAFFFITALAIFYSGIKKKNLLCIVVSAIIFSIGISMSFALLAAFLIMALLGLGMLYRSGGDRVGLIGKNVGEDIRFIIIAATVFLFVLLLFYLIMYFLFDFDLVQVYFDIVEHTKKFNSERTY